MDLVSGRRSEYVKTVRTAVISAESTGAIVGLFTRFVVREISRGEDLVSLVTGLAFELLSVSFQ